MQQAILIAEDNPETGEFVSTALQGAGYDVRTASEGAQAIAMQRSRPAELLITDIFMPGLDGFETISRFKAEFPRTPIIAMSAGSMVGMQQDLLASATLMDVAVTLRKPFTANQLLDAVRTALAPERRLAGA